jgi:hypothetical protein
MNTTFPRVSSAPAAGTAESNTLIAMQRAAISRTLRALSVPVFVVGLEWIVSGTNKIIGNFVAAFSAYASSLQTTHIFLPGLSLAVRFPIVAAKLAIATETGLGVTLVLAAFCFWRGANRIGEVVGGTALLVSAFVAVGLWLIVGRPPFWPTGNGFGSGWPVEFFLIAISAALGLAVALADPDATIFMRVTRRLRRRKWTSEDTA